MAAPLYVNVDIMDDSNGTDIMGAAYGNDVMDDTSPEALALASYIALYAAHDWNERFQTILVARGMGDEERSRAIRDLSSEFANSCVSCCTRIVEELFVSEKTIQSVATTGVAGGIKFIKDGVVRNWDAGNECYL
jgi:hypothetical protein